MPAGPAGEPTAYDARHTCMRRSRTHTVSDARGASDDAAVVATDVADEADETAYRVESRYRASKHSSSVASGAVGGLMRPAEIRGPSKRSSSVRGIRHDGRLRALSTGAAVIAVLAVAGCSGSSGSGSNGSGPSGSDGGSRALADSAGAAPDGYLSSGSGSAPSAAVPKGGAAESGGVASLRNDNGGLDLSAASLDRAQIKKAQLALRTDKVAGVVSSVETIATTQGGFVDSENTATDTHGVAQSSTITMRVPVDTFAITVEQVSRLGRLDSKRTTTVDVTGQVADVASRVTSAKDSITQLRVLFSHATKLGDIITLESELSARESDLEALQAQQRVLTSQTSLSTIAVSVSRDPVVVSKTVSKDDHAGFLGGLRQGWDALVTAFEETAHALGAVLPVGLTLTALGLLLWAAVRRLPRRRVDTSGSPRPAE